jgi:hypothetical protein
MPQAKRLVARPERPHWHDLMRILQRAAWIVKENLTNLRSWFTVFAIAA